MFSEYTKWPAVGFGFSTWPSQRSRDPEKENRNITITISQEPENFYNQLVTMAIAASVVFMQIDKMMDDKKSVEDIEKILYPALSIPCLIFDFMKWAVDLSVLIPKKPTEVQILYLQECLGQVLLTIKKLYGYNGAFVYPIHNHYYLLTDPNLMLRFFKLFDEKESVE